MPETLILRSLQPRVDFEDRYRSCASTPHQACVAFQIANLQCWQTALGRSEDIARTSQFPVRFSDFEAVYGLFQNRELRGCLFRLVRAQQNASRFVFAAADPSPELVQLRETESLGIFNQ